VIVTSLDLDVDPPSLDQCGTCTLCLEACPTQAFPAPGVLDARRCISYLTIEHRGDLSENQASAIGSHVYGCDVCQEVCPWNAPAPVSTDPAWQPRVVWDRRTLAELDGATDDELRQGLSGSAMARAKLSGLRRNIAAALARTGGTGKGGEDGEDAHRGGARSAPWNGGRRVESLERDSG